MRDPLGGFDWQLLYQRYDAMCTRFQAHSKHLEAVEPPVSSDRMLYYHLLTRFQRDRGSPAVGDYEAMLYWKLYSHHRALGNLSSWLRPEKRKGISDGLASLVADLPLSVDRNLSQVLDLIRIVGRHGLVGMKSSTALPMRTTFLHFFYPNVVPIFDKMVLQAVGIREKGANQKLEVLREYVPFAWELADRHATRVDGLPETPVRLTDMALWVVRSTGNHGEGCSA